MKKRVFYTELAYLIGLIAIALGAALMARADLGMSMVVAPAYVLHLKISQFWPMFSFGMAEYTFQALLLIVMMLVLRRWKLSFLFSFVTAVIYGFILDGCMLLTAPILAQTVLARILLYVGGMICCSVGVSLVFHTYISPEVYELFVKEFSASHRLNIHRVKTVYDCSSCALGVILSFAFFGLWQFEGVKLGTIVCALINGFLISRCTHVFEHFFDFRDGLPLRKFFEDADRDKQETCA